MQRRHFSWFSGLTMLAPLAAWSMPAERIGVLMLHGKSPGSNLSPSFTPMKGTLEREGWLVTFPDMPWSRTRYLNGHWDQAMIEIGTQVQSLQRQGATRIVLMGHSMGVSAAMSYAARGGTVHALVLLAPGHMPRHYYAITEPRFKPVRDSIDQARTFVTTGKGAESQRFSDLSSPLVATPKNFLSYFDPDSDADMSVTAPRIPANVPVLTAIGEGDPLFQSARHYYADKLPANPHTQFLEVKGGHLDTPRVASDQIVAWIKKVFAEQ
ncbi:MAG: alpha/beta hydrolase [Hylemonella sp.]